MPIAVMIIGWRSDEGAYLVDAYPDNVGDYIDGQDIMNLFNIHRMAANGVMERAKQDFNYIRLSEGYTIVSWYSGFRTTEFLARPNFCVAVLLAEGENPNLWEVPLHTIAYNILQRLEDDNLGNYMAKILGILKQGEMVEPDPGYPGLSLEDEEIETQLSDNSDNLESFESPDEMNNGGFDDDFSDLLALAEEQSSTASSTFTNESDPFASSADPFSGSSSGSDPFAGDPFASSAPSTKTSAPSTISSATQIQPKGGEVADIVQELNNLDRTMPTRPDGNDPDSQVKFLEKKVAFLEAKIGVIGKLARGLQAKEIELQKKNAVIDKLLRLLR